MNKNKVLVIDDELYIRTVLSELLSFENYDVSAAANGQEALEILEDWTPDIIVCDLLMPVMDGYLFHEIVKENKSLCAIPFVFLTAKEENNTMQDCLLNGADAFLSKPFKIDELLKVLQNKVERFEKIKNAHTNLYSGKKKYFSHEVNISLNGILGSINLLLNNQDTLTKYEIAQFYDYIKISGERLDRTMQNVFLYQKIVENKLNFEEDSSCNVMDVFSKVKDKLIYTYDIKSSVISYTIVKLNLKISNDNLAFILFELMDNALKFSDAKQIIISGKKYNNIYYQLEIYDRGIGFHEEELKGIDAGIQFNR